LVRLVDDLLDASRILQDKIELRREKVDLAALIGRAIETAQPAIDAQRHELHVSLPRWPIVVHGDLIRLAQVISNLLVNAAKYTPKAGRIWLSAEREGEEAVIRVKDTGVGMASDLIPRVFNLFVQADRSPARSEGGLGIGLTLVKRLVEMHGGCVRASSPGPGQGSEFTVELPALPEGRVKAKEDSHSEDSNRPAGPRRRVLVVDDNVDAAESTAVLLRLAGHEVKTVYDGPAAIEAARDFQPQVALVDIGLPGMTGHEVARQLRSRPELAGLILAAVTGYGQDEDKRRSQEAGFEVHLTKPLDPNILEAFLAAADSFTTRTCRRHVS
jgi:CheY-like chemotaxis protein/two-component sensor histidine kinase